MTTVVSMLHLSEMRVRGVPDDWEEYFAQRGVQQYVYSLDDVAPKTATLKARQTKVCLQTWLRMCFQLWSLRRSWLERRPLVVLFHCFGGRNRSTAAACAWLIIGHGFTAETAMCHVLGPKRSLRPWKNRLYVPLALLLLQQARNVVVDAFDTLLKDSPDMAQMDQMDQIAPVPSITKYTALMSASVAKLADGEAVDVPSNIQSHAFKNTPEEVGHGFVLFCFVLSGSFFVIERDPSRGSMSNTPSGIGERAKD